MLFSNDDIVERISGKMYVKGLSLNALAEESGVPSSSLSRYLSKKINFPMKYVEPVAKALGTTEQYLLGLSSEYESMHNARIPVLGEIACGLPILAEENVSEYVTIPLELIASDESEYFFLKAEGQSMVPTIMPGSKVLIHQQDTVEKGKIAAVLFLDSGEATLKRIKYSGNMLFLSPGNMEYDPIIVTEDINIKILGRAVQVINEL